MYLNDTYSKARIKKYLPHAFPIPTHVKKRLFLIATDLQLCLRICYEEGQTKWERGGA